jgi:hypothetical protein
VTITAQVKSMENISEAEKLRENTNYQYTRTLTNIIDKIFTAVSVLFLLSGVVCFCIGFMDEDDYFGYSFASMLFSLLWYLVGKLLFELTNMMTDVADSNVKLVTQFNELIEIQFQKIITEDTQNQKPVQHPPMTKTLKVVPKNISDFDSGASPMV